jgi:hypothetical protein
MLMNFGIEFSNAPQNMYTFWKWIQLFNNDNHTPNKVLGNVNIV